MDRKLQEKPEIERLIRLSQASRACLATEAIALRKRLDVPARIRGSLKLHPMGWLFGSLASGLFASRLFRRRPAAPKKRRGISGSLLALTLTAARPLAKVWLTRQVTQWASGDASRSRTSLSQEFSPPASHVHSSGSGSR